MLHYTCLTQILFMNLPKLLALNGSINKQNYFENWSGTASTSQCRREDSCRFGSVINWFRGCLVADSSMSGSNPLKSNE